MTTANEIRTLSGTKTAKTWGFKSIKDAEKKGYNALPTSITVSEIASLLKVTERDAYNMIYRWRDNGEGTFSQCANLNTFYFNS